MSVVTYWHIHGHAGVVVHRRRDSGWGCPGGDDESGKGPSYERGEAEHDRIETVVGMGYWFWLGGGGWMVREIRASWGIY